MHPPVFRRFLFGAALLIVMFRQASISPAAETPAAKTRDEVNAAIAEAGRTHPGWWSGVKLDFPNTLQLDWSGGGKASPDYRMALYLDERIYPNPSRWTSGVRLLHHCVEVNGQKPSALRKSQFELAEAYRLLLGDYARAAYWYLQAKEHIAVGLAECYRRLGNKQMAVEVLDKHARDDTRDGEVATMWAAIGDLDRGLKLAEDMVRRNRPTSGNLAAALACMAAGEFGKAKAYLNKVLTAQTDRRNWHAGFDRQRAKVYLDALTKVPNFDLTKAADGTYTGTGRGYKGPVTVEVTLRSHAIASVRVTRHRENRARNSIGAVPVRIVHGGSPAVHAVSGATVTSNAIVEATAAAIAKAMR